jgi:hypothetical protein
MVKDNKIARLFHVAGVKIQKHVDDAEDVETSAKIDPCSRWSQIDVPRIAERNMKKP